MEEAMVLQLLELLQQSCRWFVKVLRIALVHVNLVLTSFLVFRSSKNSMLLLKLGSTSITEIQDMGFGRSYC
jgi:hypothetical protein